MTKRSSELYLNIKSQKLWQNKSKASSKVSRKFRVMSEMPKLQNW